jgi:sugar transferase (PEP-CTERM/EpsH1 system associated)
MKILFVCHRLPYPPTRGGKIRPFNMICHLGKEHSVVVASLAHSDDELRDGSELTQYCEEVIAELLPAPVRWKQAFQALPTSTPSSVAYFRSARLHRRVQDVWRKHRFDVVWVHCAFVAQYVIDLPVNGRVLDYGDLDSGKWSDYSHFRVFPLSAGYALEARKLQAYERLLASQFQQCTVTAPGELEELRRLGISSPCTVIPNGVDFSYFRLRTARNAGPPVLVFLGRMDYFPNVDGIVYFVRDILPRVREKVPNTQLRIVGSNPARTVRNLGRIPGITVTGHVPDVRPLMEDATISVVPLRICRGTQNKMLECMSMGVPIVATSKAAKGTQAVCGKHFLVADNPEFFAQEVVRLLGDPALREEIAASARQYVETKHAWAASMRIVDTILARAAATDGVKERVATGPEARHGG